MSEIKWQEPPNPKSGPGRTPRWAAEAAALRERPGEWALIAEGVPSGTAGNLRAGRYRALSEGFEAVSRKREDGNGHDIYARFVGEAGEHA